MGAIKIDGQVVGGNRTTMTKAQQTADKLKQGLGRSTASKPVGETQAEEKKCLESNPEKDIVDVVEEIRNTVDRLNNLIASASQMKIQCELDSTDITTYDSMGKLTLCHVRIYKIL